MIELILGTYGALCWLVFKKWKLIPVNTYTVFTAILGAVLFLLFLFVVVNRYHPASADGRLYTLTTPIVPVLKGRITDVYLTEGAPVRAGDPLFRIDPAPFELEVQRLTAALADASTGAAQLEQQSAAAGSGVRQAEGELARVRSELALANKEYERFEPLVAQGSVSRQRFDQVASRRDELRGTVARAEAALKQSQARERESALALNARSDGMNPKVRQLLAELDLARWNLEQTTTRAPTDGYVTQMVLRPGQLVVPFSMNAVMVFVHDDPPVLVASFPQNVIAEFTPGMEAELAFRAYPGRIFSAKVYRVMPATAEGQLTPSGALRTGTAAGAPGRIPVVFHYPADVAALGLPGGSQATVAVYGDDFSALALIRRIILRIKSWENYIFLP